MVLTGRTRSATVETQQSLSIRNRWHVYESYICKHLLPFRNNDGGQKCDVSEKWENCFVNESNRITRYITLINGTNNWLYKSGTMNYTDA